VDEGGNVRYFEPAVLVGTRIERCAEALNLWASHSEADGGIVSMAGDVPVGDDVQRTLVLLKPDNFRFPSHRAGHIIDTLSMSGLRIVGAKKVSMTVAQAEEFYAPVRAALAERFLDIGGARVSDAIGRELGVPVPDEVARDIAPRIAPLFATAQFETIVEFMTGFRPSQCAPGEKGTRCREECLALVYEGREAIGKIRDLLGPTDPNKARPGSVRREFGRDIMVNAAHASDSPENAERELRIVRVDLDGIAPLVRKYYGKVQ
jgi:nucleoside diphosphate kinase